MLRRACILALCLVPTLASAQLTGPYEEPEYEDPCDNPILDCLSLGSAADAATTVYEQMEEDAENNCFGCNAILWMAENLTADIPGDPRDKDDDDEEEGEGQGEAEQQPDPKPETPPNDEETESDEVRSYDLGGGETILRVRTWLDRVDEGERLRMRGYDGPPVLLHQKREHDTSRVNEYVATLRIGRGRRAVTVIILADGERVYVIRPIMARR